MHQILTVKLSLAAPKVVHVRQMISSAIYKEYVKLNFPNTRDCCYISKFTIIYSIVFNDYAVNFNSLYCLRLIDMFSDNLYTVNFVRAHRTYSITNAALAKHVGPQLTLAQSFYGLA